MVKYAIMTTKNKKDKYTDGICLEKKENPSNIGILNQEEKLFFFKANIKYIKAKKEK